MMSYQYFINIVPTSVNTYKHYGNSFQYSVTELKREISHKKGSHGTPGIFFKYDVSALKVEVSEEHESFLQFLTRLIGIIGGVFTCSGLVHRFVGVLIDCLFCRYFQKISAAFKDGNLDKPILIHQSVSSISVANTNPTSKANTSLLISSLSSNQSKFEENG